MPAQGRLNPLLIARFVPCLAWLGEPEREADLLSRLEREFLEKRDAHEIMRFFHSLTPVSNLERDQEVGPLDKKCIREKGRDVHKYINN